MDILLSISLACTLCVALVAAQSQISLCVSCSSSTDQKCAQADYADDEVPSIPCEGICYTKITDNGSKNGIERGCHNLNENDPTDQCIHNYGCHGSHGNASCLVCCGEEMCNILNPEVVMAQWDKCFECSMTAEGDSCTAEGFNPYDSQMNYRPCPGDCATVSIPALPNLGLVNPAFVRSCTVPYLVNNVICDPSESIEDGEEVCKEVNYGRKNPKGRTCCCRGDFCNGPITPTFAPTTIWPSTTPIMFTTQDETAGPLKVTMNSTLGNTSTQASGARTFASYSTLSLNYFTVFCYIYLIYLTIRAI